MTTLQRVYKNWEKLNDFDFNEWFVLNKPILLQQEKEQIIDAIEEDIFHTSNKTAEEYYNETYDKTNG